MPGGPDAIGYLLSAGARGVRRRPRRSALPTVPNARCRLSGEALVEGDVRLWSGRFAGGRRCGHDWLRMGTGAFVLEWTAEDEADATVLAIRMVGRGELELTRLALEIASPDPTPSADAEALRTGRRGGYRAWSLFADPSADLPMTDRHRRHYRGRGLEWYAGVAAPFAGAGRVLDLGGGPGLLAAALVQAGVAQVEVIERDPAFLEACRQTGAVVHEHDLSWPMPFLASASFDGAVAHQVLDYLPPTAQHGLLRELHRVLRPEARCSMALRLGGPAAGDPSRPDPTEAADVQGAAEEAGFAVRASRRGGGSLRLSLLRSAKPQTHTSSDIVTADADPRAGWPRPPWRSDRLDLYRVRDGLLVARPGAAEPRHALAREEPLERECQCSGAITGGLEGGGTVRVAVRWGEGEERVLFDSRRTEVEAWTVRVLRPRLSGPEAVVRGWRGGILALDEQVALADSPACLRVEVSVPPDGEPLAVDHLDVWTVPAPPAAPGDAHVYGGVARSGDPLLPDVSADDLLGALDEAGVGRALAAPYGAGARLDGFDELARAAQARPGAVHPLLRLPALDRDGVGWNLDQLELLWQQRVLFGLKVHLGSDELPPGEVLDWVAQRDLPTLWHVARPGDLDTLERDVLPHLPSPVLLSHFGGYPLDRRRYERAIAMLDAWPQVHLVTSMVWFAAYLREAAMRCPDRVLLGSDFPAVDPVVAQLAIRRLGLPGDHEQLVLGHGLRFVLARAIRAREHALAAGDLRFPTPPLTPEEAVEQGFQVVPRGALPAAEPTEAKGFWADYGVRSFYQQAKDWDRLPGALARDVGAASVLEFGCNAGRNLAALRDLVPAAEVVGLDVNAEAVAAGRRATGLDLRVGDETALAGFPDGAFDLVFTISVLDHVVEVDAVLAELLRCAGRVAYFLEVALPLEGRVERHFDHAARGVRDSTRASYSWDLGRVLGDHPRTWRVDRRPVYLHPRSLGPYYAAWTAWLDEPRAGGR